MSHTCPVSQALNTQAISAVHWVSAQTPFLPRSLGWPCWIRSHLYLLDSPVGLQSPSRNPVFSSLGLLVSPTVNPWRQRPGWVGTSPNSLAHCRVFAGPWAEHLGRYFLVLLALKITSAYTHPCSQHQDWPLGGAIQGILAESRVWEGGRGMGER